MVTEMGVVSSSGRSKYINTIHPQPKKTSEIVKFEQDNQLYINNIACKPWIIISRYNND